MGYDLRTNIVRYMYTHIMHSNAQQSRGKDPDKRNHHRGLEGRRRPGSIPRLVLVGEDALHHEATAAGQVDEPHEENAAEHQDSEAELEAETASW